MKIINDTIYRSFAGQESFTFGFNSALSTTGRCEIYHAPAGSKAATESFLDFASGRLLLAFESGKVFDSEKKFVKSYYPFENCYISGDVIDNLFFCYFNGKLILFQSGVLNSNGFGGVVLSSSGCTWDVNSFKVFGEVLPSYEWGLSTTGYKTGEGITGYATGEAVSGYLINTSSGSFQTAQVFSVASYFSNYSYHVYYPDIESGFKIAPGGSGLFGIKYSGSYDEYTPYLNRFTPPKIDGTLYFDTNFGRIISGVSMDIQYEFEDIPTPTPTPTAAPVGS